MDRSTNSWLPASLDWFTVNSTTTINIMTSLLWMVCVTILLGVVQAEAWLPIRLVRFHQRMWKGREPSTQRSSNEGGVDTEQAEEEGEAAERRRLAALPWWEDSWAEAFMSSFPLSPTSVLSSPATDTPDELAHYETPTGNPSAQVLHFCFLLHGHRGFSTDLSYLQRVMQHHAELEKRERLEAENSSDPVWQQDLIVHCARCNEGKTMDGVVNGGERMVREILEVIRSELKRRREEVPDFENGAHVQDITVSIVGNSLGGIYGRYAIARLAQNATDEENHSQILSNSSDGKEESEFPSSVLLDGKYRLHFNIFCTTATPHLGISKHTYVPLPRSVEVGAAHVLGETGRDLFRLNDLMKNMATCPTFLEPLRKFKKRVAYANAYATDFPVPTMTAAFLSAESTYPHHFVNVSEFNDDATETSSDDQSAKKQDPNRHIVATLHTHPSKDRSPFAGPQEEAIVDDLVQMSYSLDSLGWKKVFIDVRKEIPIRVSLPTSIDIRKSIRQNFALAPKRLRRSLSSALSDDSGDESSLKGETFSSSSAPTSLHGRPKGADSGESAKEKRKRPLSAIQRLRQRGVVESRDVALVVSTPDDMRLSFPLGHNLMVALDRDGMAGGIYKGGRPVMDSLAKELVHDIFAWNFQEETAAAEETMKLSEKFDS